ncbi:uncharacterized protein EV420DRAFT_1577929 [Desarmillaria tabescens]|uniref:Peptidase C14 caspase domain-containing protein n=1 Tax=Armillaria tabescens TaxID=1929756 RepID=A0AA39MPV4_ARMTA|nr:uncharacterized protein EV420DRAFT_1577929 [Desarmillaria tabescens]KAK0442696.1 hypothetical protein EV420DRAFT_1577929 [Desarmillaria tabescens]
MREQIYPIQHFIANQVSSGSLTHPMDNNGNHVSDETQITKQYKMPGGIDLFGGFQETSAAVQSGTCNTRSASTSKLVEWLCQLQFCFIFLRWLHFRWTFSLKFEIRTPAGRSRTWAVLIGIDAYEGLPLHGCVADALLMQEYVIEHLGVPKVQTQLLISSCHSSSSGFLPTRNNIIQTLLSLITNPDIQPGDDIIVYFAGHSGSYAYPDYASGHSGDSYTDTVERRGKSIVALCPMDSSDIAGSNFCSPDISDREIDAIFHLISSNRRARITLILDTSSSGGFSRNLPQLIDSPQSVLKSINMLNVGHETLKNFPGYQSILTEGWYADMDSYVLLAACQEFQCAREGGGNGLFTDTLIGTLTSSELKDDSTFVDLWKALPSEVGYHQTPAVIGKYRDAPIWFRD